MNHHYRIHEDGWVIIIQLYPYKVQELSHDLVATGLNPIRVIALTYIKKFRHIKSTDTYHKEVKTFPEMDESTLKDSEEERRTARQRMLNLKFDS